MTDSLGTILNRLRRDIKYTQAQVTELLARYGYEIQPAGISKWEKDLTVPNAGQFLALCKIYGRHRCDGNIYRRRPDGPAQRGRRRLVTDYIRVLVESGLYSKAEPREVQAIPLYDLAASAGTGQFLDGESYKLIDAADAPRRADFAVRIAGDSMEPVIPDESIVWVHSCETLNTGRIGVFLYGGQAYCKRLRINSVGVMLISANRDYAPIIIREGEDFRVLGEVVGIAIENY